MGRCDSSPEFEFWMLGNPSFPQPHLLTADELFVDGVILPLRLLHFPHPDPQPETEGDPSPSLSSLLPPSSPPLPPPPPFPSNWWKDIFKAKERKDRRQKDRRGTTAAATSELNIHIWPFSRTGSSRKGGRTTVPPTECSEPTKPTTTKRAASWAGLSTGIHLGRSRPVWQLRRSSKRSGPKEKNNSSGSTVKNGGGGLNVNTCIGYRNQLSCKGVDGDRASGNDGSGGDDGGSNGSHDGSGGDDGGGNGSHDGSGGDDGGGNGSLFRLKTIFSKRVF